jgi:hypothetical protein
MEDAVGNAVAGVDNQHHTCADREGLAQFQATLTICETFKKLTRR